jgi:hypothetical protein
MSIVYGRKAGFWFNRCLYIDDSASHNQQAQSMIALRTELSDIRKSAALVSTKFGPKLLQGQVEMRQLDTVREGNNGAPLLRVVDEPTRRNSISPHQMAGVVYRATRVLSHAISDRVGTWMLFPKYRTCDTARGELKCR